MRRIRAVLPPIDRRGGRLVLFLALGAVLVPVIAAAQAATYTLEAFMTASEVGEFAWAPDGRSIYYTSNAGDTGTWEIFRISPAGGTPEQLTGRHAPALRTMPIADRAEPKENLAVAGNGRRLFFTSSRYFERFHNVFSLDPGSGQVTQHTFNDGVIETAPSPSPDGRTVAYFDRRPRGNKIYLLDVDVEGAWPRLLDPGPEAERNPVWSPAGTAMAFTRGGRIWIRDLRTGETRRLVAPHYPAVSSPTWSPDGTRMAVTADHSGFSQIAVVEVATGDLTPITYEPREHASPAWSPDGRTLAFTLSDGLGMSTQLAVAAADGSGAIEVLTSGPGVRSSPRFAPAGNEIVYIESASNRTPDLWAISPHGGSPRQITHSMGDLDPSRLTVAREVTYPAPADNLPIPALLLHPPDFDPARTYPVVIALHGHPGWWGHDMSLMRRNFHWQYLAQQGFVVMAINYRGSRGFGQGFHDLHVGDWGGTDYEDMMAGWDYLAGLGYIDMGRVATWGGSGGGYMSFLLATRDSDRVQAQIIRAPISSFELMAIDRFGASGRAWTATREPRRERAEFGGSYAEIPGEYDLRSPINFVENVNVPQLLFQGWRDTPVLPRQSQVWVDRMEELGKGDLIEFVRYPDEDHSLARYRANVADRLRRSLRFLAVHLDLPHLLSDR